LSHEVVSASWRWEWDLGILSLEREGMDITSKAMMVRTSVLTLRVLLHVWV
jgi:hypothetical protein